MEVVELAPRSIDAYAESAGPDAVSELRDLAAPLRGLRVLHVNATPHGGVAEILRSMVPLLRDLGLVANWQTVVAEPAFFTVTKAIHNALQGAPLTLTPEEQAIYDVDLAQVRIIAPAIDPLSPKNRSVPQVRALAILADLDLDPGRPLIAQVSRLDPWKDPIGVIDAYRLVRKCIPGLQLALLGVIAARDDPEAVDMAQVVRAHADSNPDIHIYTDPAQVGPEEVAAVQQTAQVVFQKSLREGFGLAVAEALWKVTPVVGGQVGGIPLQLQDGVGGYLVASVAEAAERTRWLLEHPPEARAIAARGRERIRANFLITRLLADEFRLYADVLGQRVPDAVAADR